MANFVDGPAADVSLFLRRAPRLLRVVQSPSGVWDALDQLDDEPRPREKLWVYERMSAPNIVHIKMSPRKASGLYAFANYRLFQDQPAEEVMRDTAAWRAWCDTYRLKPFEEDAASPVDRHDASLPAADDASQPGADALPAAASDGD